MSLKPSPIQPVPEETARIARAAFRKCNLLLKLRDELGTIFADTDFADLFPRRGQPGLAPWRSDNACGGAIARGDCRQAALAADAKPAPRAGLRCRMADG